jgi:hypothetical protein
MRRSRSILLRPGILLIWTIAMLTASCGPRAVVKTALQGDLPSLKQEIARARTEGKLDPATVTELARAVAGRELRSASGPEATTRIIEEVRPCARSLTRVLRVRAEHRDDAGAAATLLLLEIGEFKPDEMAGKYLEAADPAWRSVGARAAISPKYAIWRRERFLDPDERVRRAALQAARVRPDGDDVEALLEVARLDPDPEARALAIGAAGKLGGSRVTLALLDLWAQTDADTVREAMVSAWSEPSMVGHGGREQLVDLAEQRKGLGSLSAAETLVRLGSTEAEIGRAVLAYFVAHGTDSEQRQAIRAAPLTDPDVITALHKLAEDRDRKRQVLAWARLTELPQERAAALTKLRVLAQGKDDTASLARTALAEAKDPSVAEPLRTALTARKTSERRLAARGLLALGDMASLATALGDDDPRLRSEIACSILARPQ